jgi:preprotein translocase subunit SecY
VVTTPGWGFQLMTMLTLTTGTAFLMWIGEQITERGVGNGTSLLIFASIVTAFPSSCRQLHPANTGTTSSRSRSRAS